MRSQAVSGKARRRFGTVQGKVRDTYVVGDRLVIVTTDRQSAFDRLLASIPFKVAFTDSLPGTSNCEEAALEGPTALRQEARAPLKTMSCSCKLYAPDCTLMKARSGRARPRCAVPTAGSWIM